MMLTRPLVQDAVTAHIVDWNLKLYIVLIGAVNRTGLFGAN